MMVVDKIEKEEGFECDQRDLGRQDEKYDGDKEADGNDTF